MKKIASFILLSTILLLAACTNNKVPPIVNDEFSYFEQILSDSTDYNAELYYLNSLEFQLADPSVIYVEEGEEAGYFYAYGTSDDIRVYGFQSWRSKDLTHWESMGVAFKPNFNNTWAIINYWAPEIIYDKEDKLYYMFYNAQTIGTNIMRLSVAYSEFPQGPFISPDNIRNADGKMLYANQAVFDFTNANTAIDSDLVRRHAIDASPFLDPVTGDKYMYFSYYDTFNQSEIFGVKMKDWFTPDYSTLKQLTAVGYLTVEDGLNSNINARIAEGTINEGPFMYYQDGTYYMTLSVYGYTDEKYQVRQALSDDPLGTFVKPQPEEGGTVIATDAMWGHITSAGHHVFVEVGEELFIAYHTFLNRSDITEGRALAFDKVVMTEKNGLNLLHTNGPTYSLQPLPEAISGYKNVAPLATVVANNTFGDSSVAYLTDGIMPYLSYDQTPEYTADMGVSTITFTWDEFVIARSIFIYNSAYYEDSFLDVAEINIYYKANANGDTQVVQMNNLVYDWDWHVDANTDSMKPGGAVISEFADLPINKIEIKISSVLDSYLSIPEIVVLGKEVTNPPAVLSFSEYTYENPVFGSPELITEGTVVGTNAFGGLKTQFGYDLTHDDGTEDAYIVQNWPYDQYGYFKNIWSTKFYVEAEFTVTHNQSYANDPFPKFGLTVSTPENTIFFFVDANPTFTRDAVGTAQRTLDNSDWDWNATEQNVSGTGISYKQGDFVKLAIIRDGKEFFMIADDVLYIYYDEFNVFHENYLSTVGFLTFNTELLIRNYSATQDASLVDAKKALYASEINGEVFGMSSGYKTTPGWNLSTDDGTADAYLENHSTGDQYAYFKNFEENYFYAEIKVTTLEHLGDPFPKFGLALRNGNRTFFFFIEANPSYTNKNVGYVQRDANGDWDWPNIEIFANIDINYKDGDYTTLGLLRDHENIYLYVNSVLITTIENATGFGENEVSVVGVLSFTTAVRIKDYFITTDEAAINSKLES